MNWLTVVVTLLLLAQAVALFFLLRLELPIRILILVSDLVGTAIVAYVLWRRASRR
jgi:hypothetical protein